MIWKMESMTVLLFQLQCVISFMFYHYCLSQLTTFNGMAEPAHLAAASQSQVL